VRQFRVLAVGLLLAAAPAGCGGHESADVFSVKRGMTKEQVRRLAGSPYRAGPKCWLYRASKEGTPIDAMRFCFTNGRVSLVQTGVHG
jgi:SmpA / OmlA family